MSFFNIKGVSIKVVLFLLAYMILPSVSAADSVVAVEVIKKEAVGQAGSSCKLHFQFHNHSQQTLKAQINSYQLLDLGVKFGMTGEKTVKPNAKRVSAIKTNSACERIKNISIRRASCTVVTKDKKVLSHCDKKMTLISNEFVTLQDDRKS